MTLKRFETMINEVKNYEWMEWKEDRYDEYTFERLDDILIHLSWYENKLENYTLQRNVDSTYGYIIYTIKQDKKLHFKLKLEKEFMKK